MCARHEAINLDLAVLRARQPLEQAQLLQRDLGARSGLPTVVRHRVRLREEAVVDRLDRDCQLEHRADDLRRELVGEMRMSAVTRVARTATAAAAAAVRNGDVEPAQRLLAWLPSRLLARAIVGGA